MAFFTPKLQLNVQILNCCGIQEVTPIASSVHSYGPEKVVQDIAASYRKGFMNGTFILFSGIEGSTYGKYGPILKQFIEDTKLGTVVVSDTKKNPNSNNMLTIYIWQVDRPRLAEWLEKVDPAKPDPPPAAQSQAAQPTTAVPVGNRIFNASNGIPF